MYRYPGFYHYYRSRTPRLFWFVLGGVAATWFIKHKEMHSDESRIRWCRRVPVQALNHDDPFSSYPVGATNPGQFRDPSWRSFEQQKVKEWEEEKAHLLALGRHAGDTVSELSEATLDSILSLAESLKIKLADHRARRDQQQKDLLNEERRNSPRLV